MKTSLTCAVLLALFLPCRAQQFAAGSIPNDLKAKAHAVVRYHHTEFVVKNISQATKTIEGAITILDEKGEGFASIVVPYNKFTKVNDISAQLYDADGKQLKKLKKADIESVSGASGANEIDDSFYKVASLTNPTYPYTVAFKIEYTTQNMMFYPTWSPYPYDASEVAVEKTSFKMRFPTNTTIRYKESNLSQSVTKTANAGENVYLWEAQNLKAIDDEPLSPKGNPALPRVVTAPVDFSVDDYAGQLNTWNDVAKFINKLNKDRDELPEPLIKKIKQLVQNETSTVEKVRKVYQFLQQNTRYVSIQLGIGGWQTMKAAEVYEKGYGDCKALSNYTFAMLKMLGIKSHQVLVRAGNDEPDIETDFPAFQFNHVFVCVPMPKDTLWLECTSQQNPFGYLGSFTSDRHVLLLNDAGGSLIKTPVYRPIDNQLKRRALVVVQENDGALAEVHTEYTGEQSDDHRSILLASSAEEQKKWLLDNLSLAGVDLLKFGLKDNKTAIPSVTEDLLLSLRNVVTKSGSRIFLTPNLLNKIESSPLGNANRKNDFEIRLNYVDVDSIYFELPKGYVPEYQPEAVKIESKYGRYESSVQYKDGKLLYCRRMTMNKGVYSVTSFNEYVDFRKKLIKADKSQIVLVMK